MSKTYDAVVAGGGLIGASIALELAEQGLRVGLFDAKEPGNEASWAGAGMVSPSPEGQGMIPLVPLSKASAAMYPKFVAHVEGLSGMEAGYRQDGAMEVFFEENVQEEVSTLMAVYHGVGLRAEALSRESVKELEPALTERVRGGVLRPDESSLDSRELTRATLKAGERKGVEIHANTAAKGIWKAGKRCKGLTLADGKVEAKWTVVAAGCFSAEIGGVEAYAPVSPTKGQIVLLQSETVNIEHVIWTEHAYLVPRGEGRILAGSTMERMGFDRTMTMAGVKKIIDGALEAIPALETAKIEEMWAGLRPDSPDHLPILGPVDIEGLLFATGHFRSGILLAPITAQLIGEWVKNERVSLDWERFSPMRFLEAGKTQSAR